MLELADARSPVLLLLLHTGEGIFGIDQCKDLSDFNPFALSRSFSQQSSEISELCDTLDDVTASRQPIVAACIHLGENVADNGELGD